jgi:ribonuclease BN (tRNA processing enzyme)
MLLSKSKTLSCIFRPNSLKFHQIYRSLTSLSKMTEFDDLLSTLEKLDKSSDNLVDNISSLYLRIIGTGNHGSPKSFMLVIDQKKYLFNCGEGASRILKEMGYKKLGLENIFFTNSSWHDCFSGTLNLLNEIFQCTKELTIHSPFDAVEFIKDTFGDLYQLKTAKNIKLEQYDYAKNKEFSNESLNVKTFKLNDVNAYLITLTSKEFKSDKIKTRSIERFSHSKKDLDPLKNLQFYKILVVDLPSLEYLEIFEKNSRNQELSNLDLIVHMSPSKILKSQNYRRFFEKIGRKNKINIYLDETETNLISREIYQKQSILNQINGWIFPLLPFKYNSDTINAKTSMFYELKSQSGSKGFLNNFTKWNNVNPNEIAMRGSDLEKIRKIKLEDSRIDKESYPRLLFLGTSSGATSLSRNQSGILVQLDKNQSILMDCGIGVLGQFIRFYGEDNYERELVKLKVLFISHMHLDHCQGLMSLIEERVKAFENLKLNYEKLVLLYPSNLLPFINSYKKYFKNIFANAIDLVNNESLLDLLNSQQRENVFKKLDNLKLIQTSNVFHIEKSYGLIIETKNDIKIVYTSDCSPSREIVKKGFKCNILIHEATYNDQNIEIAAKYRHSTVSQASVIIYKRFFEIDLKI